MTRRPARAVVLLSGGADSATCLALARSRGREVYAISFDYGQRHRIELRFARSLAKQFGCTAHRIVRIDLPDRKTSALTSRAIDVPKKGAKRGVIPITYVPARNMIFLAHAVSWAEVIGASEIWIGANILDYSGYPDCRPPFLRAFERMANLGTKAGAGRPTRPFRIVAPLLKLRKTEIFQLGASLGVDFKRTLSCYDPSRSGQPCLRCDSCRLRESAFSDLAR